jgi:hypothetical protein
MHANETPLDRPLIAARPYRTINSLAANHGAEFAMSPRTLSVTRRTNAQASGHRARSE